MSNVDWSGRAFLRAAAKRDNELGATLASLADALRTNRPPDCGLLATDGDDSHDGVSYE